MGSAAASDGHRVSPEVYQHDALLGPTLPGKVRSSDRDVCGRSDVHQGIAVRIKGAAAGDVRWINSDDATRGCGCRTRSRCLKAGFCDVILRRTAHTAEELGCDNLAGHIGVPGR